MPFSLLQNIHGCCVHVYPALVLIKKHMCGNRPEPVMTCVNPCCILQKELHFVSYWIQPWQILASLKVPLHPSVLAPTQFYQSSSLSCTPVLSYAHKRVSCAKQTRNLNQTDHQQSRVMHQSSCKSGFKMTKKGIFSCSINKRTMDCGYNHNHFHLSAIADVGECIDYLIESRHRLYEEIFQQIPAPL